MKRALSGCARGLPLDQRGRVRWGCGIETPGARACLPLPPVALRAIFHQKEGRIEARLCVAFPACRLPMTLGRQQRNLAPRSVLDKFAARQMLDIPLPTATGGK